MARNIIKSVNEYRALYSTDKKSAFYFSDIEALVNESKRKHPEERTGFNIDTIVMALEAGYAMGRKHGEAAKKI